MNEMNDLYDIIDAMRKKYRMSSRTLAMQAKIPATTLASMMTRRPATIDKEALVRIASVFCVEWYRLLNMTEDEASKCEDELRISTAMTAQDVEYVYNHVVKPLDCSVRYRAMELSNAERQCMLKPIHQRNEREHGFRSSILFVLEKLNDDGLMEAMRRILDVANDPKYCKPKKEDDSWQKEKPPMGAEQSESVQTVDTRDEFPLE